MSPGGLLHQPDTSLLALPRRCGHSVVGGRTQAAGSLPLLLVLHLLEPLLSLGLARALAVELVREILESLFICLSASTPPREGGRER